MQNIQKRRRKLKIEKQTFILSILIVLSVFIMAGKGLYAEVNIPLTVDAGDDLTIPSSDIATTIIIGTVLNPDNTGSLRCIWVNQEDSYQWTGFMDVGPNGECPLDLSSPLISSPLVSGIYTLMLYGIDGYIFASDSMLLTIYDDDLLTVDAGPDPKW
jgi:hypothetical protein